MFSMDWTPAFAGVTGLIRASLGKKPTGFLLYIIQAKAEAASPVNVSTVLRVPLKIHIPSLPRRREPSQINKLDSRPRGNDEFLEVPIISADASSQGDVSDAQLLLRKYGQEKDNTRC